MKANLFPLLLSIIILAGLLAGVFAFPVSAEGDNPLIIQLAPTGQARAHAVTYSPDGKSLAVGSSLGIYFFNSSDLQLIRFIPTDTWVRTLAFSPDGSLLASGSYDPIVRLWQASDGMLLRELSGHTAWVRALTFSLDGSLLATASDDNTVRLWNVVDATPFHTFYQGTEGVRTVAFSPDGSILATGGYDNIIRLWKISDGILLRELKGHTGWVRALDFSPNGEWLASGAFDATVRLWRVSDGQLLATREEHASSVLGLDFSPDGKLLASASVDETVRLWEMPTAEPYHLLRGHTDFVFSVAFSPDGKSLVSGAVDNTVRVWEVPQKASPSAQEIVSSPSNCKACHHPRGLQGPPRVIETGCSVCHDDGALALNWCPYLPRPSAPVQLSMSLPGWQNMLNVPIGNNESSVVIFKPGNGELFYSQGETLNTLEINGRVYSSETALNQVEVELGVWSGMKKITTVLTQPDAGGLFSFSFNLAGLGNPPNTDAPQEYKCLECHYKAPHGILPVGEIHLVITVKTMEGLQARDERLIFINNSGVATILVQALLDTGQPIPDLPIRAETRLYEWRGRTFTATSDANGQANLQVEALSQNPTTYQISVPSTVINGVLYESKGSVQVTLPPGATEAPAVTLHAQTASGEISGHFTGLDTPVHVWSISLPDGSVNVATTSSQGAFSFANLRVGQYLLVADPQALAQQELTLSVQEIDLVKSPSAKIELTPQPLASASLYGNVVDENGASLPFVWANAESETQQSDPASGAYTLFGLPDEQRTIIVTVPGYYSQAQVADASPLDFNLARRPETRLLPWGAGTVVLPDETVAYLDGQTVTFEQGWLWGEGESEQPLVIQLDGTQITIPSGRFALERLPAQVAWFYLFEGEARIQTSGAQTPIKMGAGQMVRLEAGEGIQIVGYDPVAVQALRPASKSPLSQTWQPSLAAQVRDRLAMAGINAAQVVTFIMYALMTLVVIGLPFFGLYWWWKRRLDHAS